MSSSFSPRVASPNLSRRNTGNQQADHSPVTIGSPSLDRHAARFSRGSNQEEADRNSRRISARETLLRRVSGRSSGTGADATGTDERKAARPLEVLTNAPKLPQSLTNEQMYSNFEEWMKMCTDNKINATNSWNFALIDYFHEMTFLKDGDSINFQKASCTLDGCVKIYTSRVDSVATETGKLLSGLANSANVAQDDEDGDGEDDTERRTKKKSNRSETTLVKDFSSIKVKKLDLDFTVDPLFKKTSADFDEGGARGLLLNNLTVDRGGKIIFDASDAFADPEDDDEVPTPDLKEKKASEEKAEGDRPPVDAMDIESSEVEKKEDDNKIEVSRLKAKLPSLEELSILEISPSLREFEFSSSNALDIPAAKSNNEDTNPDNSQEIEPEPEFPQEEGNNDMDDVFNEIDNDQEQEPDANQEESQLGGFFEPANPGTDAATVRTYEMAMNPDLQTDMFSYFDSAFMRNWAGPEHWKLRRPVSKAAKEATEQGVEEGDETQKGKKKPKVVFEIDFLNSEDINEEELFANDKKGSITMPVKRDAKNSTHLLPDDMHFSSKQLLHYFLKPDRSFRKRKPAETTATVSNDQIDENVQPDEPDAQYWAQEEEMAIDDGNLTQADLSFAGDQTILTAVEDTTFLQDAFDEINDAEMDKVYGDELITNHRLKKIKPIYVNYAKTAKRVDVRRLKDNLWKTLKTEPVDDKPVMPESSNTLDEETEDAIKGEHKFSEVIHNLKKEYSEKSMKDISVPFCFICLLHLANEKKLKISNEADPEDLFDAMGSGLKDLIVVQD
ncbi:hypothetical protein INT44_000348 [Umbelopsis vinacea]|uniref:Condensin complex subunit 2 n=1 Tax=Umbelopsis vinacea TaxID=44442 RepID=A0A8H7PLD9_9FUNG|nr:hypothetical protein INT44_000348 [Umbelopsis vinacea]